MKVALVHDWLTGMRGGEKCLEAACELFPDADIFTLLHRKGTVSPTIERHRIVTSFLQRFPEVHRYYRYLLPLFPTTIERLDLSGYDLVLSMSGVRARGRSDNRRRLGGLDTSSRQRRSGRITCRCWTKKVGGRSASCRCLPASLSFCRGSGNGTTRSTRVWRFA
jgi:hypothetical protein